MSGKRWWGDLRWAPGSKTDCIYCCYYPTIDGRWRKLCTQDDWGGRGAFPSRGVNRPPIENRCKPCDIREGQRTRRRNRRTTNGNP